MCLYYLLHFGFWHSVHRNAKYHYYIQLNSNSFLYFLEEKQVYVAYLILVTTHLNILFFVFLSYFLGVFQLVFFSVIMKNMNRTYIMLCMPRFLFSY